MRYKGYNANLGRTFIVDPTKVDILCSNINAC
jgi:nucleosome binding factor SPN SPT16 subunit